METVNTLAQVISQVGFPIVMCLLLYNRMEKQDELHKIEMDKITEALNNNTIALRELVVNIGGGQ